jgi:hypothetical protein
MSSLRTFSVLGVSAVNYLRESAHRRAAEHAEVAQRETECELAFPDRLLKAALRTLRDYEHR